jgi:hypothetical protein
MVKLLLAAVVVVGVILGATAFSTAHHATGPVPTGPVVVTVQMPQPLGGGKSGGDSIYVP